jgi:hypothetical protein
VVVVGIGNSGVDIATSLVGTAASVELSSRRCSRRRPSAPPPTSLTLQAAARGFSPTICSELQPTTTFRVLLSPCLYPSLRLCSNSWSACSVATLTNGSKHAQLNIQTFIILIQQTFIILIQHVSDAPLTVYQGLEPQDAYNAEPAHRLGHAGPPRSARQHSLAPEH